MGVRAMVVAMQSNSTPWEEETVAMVVATTAAEATVKVVVKTEGLAAPETPSAAMGPSRAPLRPNRLTARRRQSEEEERSPNTLPEKV